MEIKQQILEALLEIPQGKVTTYKNLAEKFGVHPRKVAQTMKYNKNPDIYPCYKVIATEGKIGGYSGTGGIGGKIKMLEGDGIIIVDGKIDEKFIV